LGRHTSRAIVGRRDLKQEAGDVHGDATLPRTQDALGGFYRPAVWIDGQALCYPAFAQVVLIVMPLPGVSAMDHHAERSAVRFPARR
jgi:hypothetical protein